MDYEKRGGVPYGRNRQLADSPRPSDSGYRPTRDRTFGVACDGKVASRHSTRAEAEAAAAARSDETGAYWYVVS